jgi:hypothetical protein
MQRNSFVVTSLVNVLHWPTTLEDVLIKVPDEENSNEDMKDGLWTEKQEINKRISCMEDESKRTGLRTNSSMVCSTLYRKKTKKYLEIKISDLILTPYNWTQLRERYTILCLVSHANSEN